MLRHSPGSRPPSPSTRCWCFVTRISAPASLPAFGRRFGRPKIHSLVDYRHAEFPEVSWLTNVDKDGNIDWFGVKRATDWHTDSPYEEVPPRLAILHAKEVPSQKGGTMFADMRAAYEALDEAMKRRLAGAGRAARQA